MIQLQTHVPGRSVRGPDLRRPSDRRRGRSRRIVRAAGSRRARSGRARRGRPAWSADPVSLCFTRSSSIPMCVGAGSPLDHRLAPRAGPRHARGRCGHRRHDPEEQWRLVRGRRPMGNQFSAPMSSVAIGLRSSAPAASTEGWRVRPASTKDLEAYAAGYTAFHAEFDLWPSCDAALLDEWLHLTPLPGARNERAGGRDRRARRSAGRDRDAPRPGGSRSSAWSGCRCRCGCSTRSSRSSPRAARWRWSGSARCGSVPAPRPPPDTSSRASAGRRANSGNVVIASYDERGPLGR